MSATDGQVASLPVLGGLHRDYQRTRGLRVNLDVPYPILKCFNHFNNLVLMHTMRILIQILGAILLRLST